MHMVAFIFLTVAFLGVSSTNAQEGTAKKNNPNRSKSYFQMPKEFQDPVFRGRFKHIEDLRTKKQYESALGEIDSAVHDYCDASTRIYLLSVKQSIYTQQFNAEKIIETARELQKALPDTGCNFFRFGAEMGLLNGWVLLDDFGKAKTQFKKMIDMFGIEDTDFHLAIAMIITRMLRAGKGGEVDAFLHDLEKKYPRGKVGYYIQDSLFYWELRAKDFDGAQKRFLDMKTRFPKEPVVTNADKIQKAIDFARKSFNDSTMHH